MDNKLNSDIIKVVKLNNVTKIIVAISLLAIFLMAGMLFKSKTIHENDSINKTEESLNNIEALRNHAINEIKECEEAWDKQEQKVKPTKYGTYDNKNAVLLAMTLLKNTQCSFKNQGRYYQKALINLKKYKTVKEWRDKELKDFKKSKITKIFFKFRRIFQSIKTQNMGKEQIPSFIKEVLKYVNLLHDSQLNTLENIKVSVELLKHSIPHLALSKHIKQNILDLSHEIELLEETLDENKFQPQDIQKIADSVKRLKNKYLNSILSSI